MDRRKKNLSGKIKSCLPDEIFRLLKLSGRFGDELRVNVYAVGGFVRDFLLGAKNYDIDLTVEGDGISYANYFASRKQGKVVKHSRFGTATVFLKSGKRIDISSSRQEIYRFPAALPDVSSSLLCSDLLRRDFTINALAVRLNSGFFGEAIDIFGGQVDLRKGIIRVLHKLSFEDDPTRIFRAVRFACRFNFRIEKKTKSLLRDAVRRKLCERLSGSRLRNELYLLLKEETASDAIRQLASFGGLSCIHRDIEFDSEKLKLVRRAQKIEASYEALTSIAACKWLLYLTCIVFGLRRRTLDNISRRLALSKKEREAVLSLPRAGLVSKRLRSVKKPKPGTVYRCLKGLPFETVILVAAVCDTPGINELLLKFLMEWRNLKTFVTGRELIGMGIKPGPDIGRILEKLLYAKLDGKVRTKEDELTFLNSLLKPFYLR